METKPAEDETLVPLFIPALSAFLLRAEQLKGAPLREAEVVSIRDNAVCMMVRADVAREMEVRRGYADVNPENCWQEWQAVRASLPDADDTTRTNTPQTPASA